MARCKSIPSSVILRDPECAPHAILEAVWQRVAVKTIDGADLQRWQCFGLRWNR